MLPKFILSFILLFSFVISVISHRNNKGLTANYDWDINNRVAPPNPTKYDGRYHLTPKRLREIRKNLFYWFYDQNENGGNGDLLRELHTSIPQIKKDFNFKIPFLGAKYNYTKVSMHGYLGFTDQPEHYTYPLVFPNKYWPKEKDPSFIGIFFSKCRIGKIRPDESDLRVPGVYFRLESNLKKRKDRMGVEVRERTKYDVREGISNARSFIPDDVIIVTWKNMSFSGGIDNSLYKTNSFQMVLATDKKRTYAIFNYASIKWTSHTEAGGDHTTGEGGVPAFVGFNAGNGSGAYEYKPYSQGPKILDLIREGFVNGKPGRHIFRVDQKIKSDSANKDKKSPNLAIINGTSYIRTFDDLHYRSTGEGEFVLVKANFSNDKFDIQGRFEKLGENKLLTSIATRGNLSTVIEVRLRPPQVQLRYKMDVIANGKLIYPNHHDWKYPHFDSVIVSTPNHIFNQSEITISYSSGANITVKETGNMLYAEVYAPYKFVNHTRGLFGNWSFDPIDDFVRPDGSIVYPHVNNLDFVHREFVSKWELTDKEQPGVGKSLFNRTIHLN